MATLLAPVSDEYLREIADHFASLGLPYDRSQPTRADTATLRRGQSLVLQGDAAQGIPACQPRHGAALAVVSPDVPGLFGLPVDCLNARLGAWRTGMRQARASDCRAQIAQRRSNRPRIGCRWCGAAPSRRRPPDTRGPSACRRSRRR
jgi:cytochrome c553